MTHTQTEYNEQITKSEDAVRQILHETLHLTSPLKTNQS